MLAARLADVRLARTILEIPVSELVGYASDEQFLLDD